MAIASILISETAFSDNGNIQLTSPSNVFGILSTPTFQNFCIVFEIADFDKTKQHQLEIYFENVETKKERLVFKNTIPVAEGHMDPLATTIINGVISLTKVQIDSFGLHNIRLTLDSEELTNAKVIFSKVNPQD